LTGKKVAAYDANRDENPGERANKTASDAMGRTGFKSAITADSICFNRSVASGGISWALIKWSKSP
jgi:hypothetical protein